MARTIWGSQNPSEVNPFLGTTSRKDEGRHLYVREYNVNKTDA